MTKEEHIRAEDMGDYFRIPADDRDLNYSKYLEEGNIITELEEYNSHNTYQLNKDELINMLKNLYEIKEDLESEN